MVATTVYVQNSMASYTPAETIELMSRSGARKGRLRPDKIFLSAFSAGCMVSFCSGSALIATAAPWFQENAPGLIRMISGLVFPSGIVMILISGGELFTGSNMVRSASVFNACLNGLADTTRRLPVLPSTMADSRYTRCLCIGGFALWATWRALCLSWLQPTDGGVFDNPVFKQQAINTAISKQLDPKWHQIFLRAIGCNWLVCLACFLGLQGKDVTSKVVGMWWPIFAFVTLGLEHVVANMFFIPMGIFLGAPGISVGLYIWRGMCPLSLYPTCLPGGLLI